MTAAELRELAELRRRNAELEREIAEARAAGPGLRAPGPQEREALLREEAERAAQVGTWIWDLPTNSIFWSGQLFRVLGYDPATDAPSVQAFFAAVHPDDRERVRAASEQGVNRNAPSPVAFRVRQRSGAIRECLMDGTPIHDAGGALVRFVGTVLDITERRRLEEQLLHSQRLEAIGRLAGGVAHDLNNMLTAIFGNLDLAVRHIPPQAAALEHLKQVRIAADRASGLAGQLLAFARKQVTQPVVLDPNALVCNLAQLIRPLVGGDVRLELLPGEGVWPIRIDRGQFDQVLINLALNARDAMPEGGRLVIQTNNVTLDEEHCRLRPGARPGDHVELLVSDTGQGMDESIQQYIFEPFFTTKEAGKGTGLGLATCHGIVRQHGGHIGFHSALGRGTCFRIYLPRAGGR